MVILPNKGPYKGIKKFFYNLKILRFSNIYKNITIF